MRQIHIVVADATGTVCCGVTVCGVASTATIIVQHLMWEYACPLVCVVVIAGVTAVVSVTRATSTTLRRRRRRRAGLTRQITKVQLFALC